MSDGLDIKKVLIVVLSATLLYINYIMLGFLGFSGAPAYNKLYIALAANYLLIPIFVFLSFSYVNKPAYRKIIFSYVVFEIIIAILYIKYVK